MNDFVIASLAVPVILGIFKGELLNLYQDWRTWKLRVVQEGTIVEILNPSIGKWATVRVLDYTFNLAASERVVTFEYLDGTGRKESVPFKVWAGFRKSIKEE